MILGLGGHVEPWATQALWLANSVLCHPPTISNNISFGAEEQGGGYFVAKISHARVKEKMFLCLSGETLSSP